MKIVDLVIALEWLGVAAYFVRRFMLNRRLVSLALAVMGLGWGVAGISDRAVVASNVMVVKIASLIFGILIWFSIWQVERGPRGD